MEEHLSILLNRPWEMDDKKDDRETAATAAIP